MIKLTVRDFLNENKDKLDLKLINPKVKLNKKIKVTSLIQPVLILTGALTDKGYLDNSDHCGVQVFDNLGISYIKNLSKKERLTCLRRYFSCNISCIVIAGGQSCPGEIFEFAAKKNIAVIKSKFSARYLINKIAFYLEEELAPEVSLHGTFLDVYGVGVLIIGKSGVGKSECALELIERGHRMVADDMVEVKLKAGKFLMGQGAELIRHHVEIRGLGIINVKEIFGVGAIRNRKRIGMVVTLEKWDPKKEYERLGLEEKIYKILSLKLPHLIIPVRPGRNIPILIEVSALNQRLKRTGFHPAKELNKKLIESMKKKAVKQKELDEVF
ncbi:MAG: HPr(Ser) kinase/phosphatase [Candidatus Omnitrophota bacterium]|nr:HPr(Ser) kinase/phosphatase [Candidatus Omnitrophota bacterium]